MDAVRTAFALAHPAWAADMAARAALAADLAAARAERDPKARLNTALQIVPGLYYPTYRFAIIVVTLAVAIFLYFLVMSTRIGMLIRAGAANREMAGALGPMIGASRCYAGPFGKSNRAFGFGLLAVLIGSGLATGLWSTLYLAALLVLSALTVLNRTRSAVAEARKKR